MNDKIYNDRIRQILERSDKVSRKIILSFEKELVDAYKKALKEIQKEISKLFLKFEKPTYADVIKFNRLTNLEKNIHDEIKELTNESLRITRNSIKELFSQSYYYTGYALESTGLKLAFGLLDKKTIEAAILNPMDRIKWTERLRANQIVFERQIKESLTQGLIQGKGYLEISKTVKDRAEIGAAKTMRILRTEGHRAQNMGNLQGYEKTKSAAGRLGLTAVKKWVTTIDNRTRLDHIEMNEQPANDEGLFTLPDGTITEAPGVSGVPEQDINCVPENTNVISSEIQKVTKRYYDGVLIEIRTTNNIITASPNHPILTEQGFVPLNLVNKDTKIVYCTLKENITTSDPDPNYRPSKISKVFGLANIVGTSKRVTGARPQFHSDGFNSNVDVISSNGFLWNRIQTALFENTNNKRFSFTNMCQVLFSGNSRLSNFFIRTLATLTGFVTRFNLFCSFGFTHQRPLKKFGLTSSTSIDSFISENPTDHITAGIQRYCNSVFGHSFNVRLSNVLSIKRIDFSGHLYNLETVNGFYLACNIDKSNDNYNILHNCRCTTILDIKGFGEGKIPPIKSFDEWKASKKK